MAQLWSFAASKANNDIGPVLDLAAYEARGPLGRLLSEHADCVADADVAKSSEKPVIENLFRSLTEINAEGNAVRRPQIFDDLVAVTGATADQLRAILDRFRQPGVSFITPYWPEPIEAEATVDISHEALIRCWRRIADKQTGWLQQEFRDGLIWRSLVVQTEAFAANPKNILSEATMEARGKWLTGRSEAWAKRYGNKWGEVAELLAASRREVERQRQREEEERRNAEALRAEQQRRVAAEQLLKEQDLRFEAESQARAAAEDLLEEQKKHAEAERQARDVAESLLREQQARRAATEQVLKEQELRVKAQVKLARRGRVFTIVWFLFSLTSTTLAGFAYYQSKVAIRARDEARLETKRALIAQERAWNTQNSSAEVFATAISRPEEIGQVIKMLQATIDPYGIAVLSQSLVNSSADLSEAQLREVLDVLIKALQHSTRASAADAILQALVVLGDRLSTTGDLEAARALFTASISALRENDTTDPIIQHDLSQSLLKLGDILNEEHDTARALSSYEEGLVIAEHLGRSDPSNLEWQGDLAMFYDKIGKLRKNQRDLTGAVKSYEQGLAIRDRLTKSDPASVGLQVALANSYGELASVYIEQGLNAKAREALQAGRDILARLVALSPVNARWKGKLAEFDQQLGGLKP